MRVYAALLMSLAVLALLLPLLEAASTTRKTKAAAAAGPRGRAQPLAAAPRRGRVGPRRGRQDAPAAPPAEGEEGSGDDIPTWCNPKDPMGAWLLFKGVKVNCVGKGFTDFGPYGSAPADEEEAAETSANAV